MNIYFRPISHTDLPLLVQWQAAPHVARWWGTPPHLEEIAQKYGPPIEAGSPTEVFIIEAKGQPAGLIQRYRHTDYPEWDRAVGILGAVGIDFYMGEPRLLHQGIASAAIGSFSRLALERYPEATCVVAAPQQANIGSWRALERAEFKRLWSRHLDSEDPSDHGPSYIYAFSRDDDRSIPFAPQR